MEKDTSARFDSFNAWLRHATQGITDWLGKLGLRLGLHPDAVSIAGLLVVALAGWFVAQGQFLAAGLTLLFGSLLDVWDGAIARAMNRRNRFGALLDSTLDRYADGLICGGLAYWFAANGQLTEMLLALAALIGSFGVSYVRARAEGLNIRSIREGFFDRFVRVTLMIVMLVVGFVVPGIVLLALGTHLTALQRVWLVYQETRQDETP